ncbi:YraN family protein [Zhouia sp. PK063]|uniref:YraN family protein n=1 Tax=Zhouia sp. PK063 TaxID=3373602 RepID=UPI00378BEF84
MATHNDLGIQGEEMARAFLLKNGYDILETNYRFGKAEIDIIAFKNAMLVIIEVKTRVSTYFGNPEQFVSKKKIKLLTDAAHNYIIKNDLDAEVRFDIISIIINSQQSVIKHIKNAFFHF